MKIAVTGPQGRLGSDLVKRGCSPMYADVTSPTALQREIVLINPDLIVRYICSYFSRYRDGRVRLLLLQPQIR